MAVKTHYNITHSCGHTATRDLSHKAAGDRSGLASWFAKKPCFDCHRAAHTDTDALAKQRAEDHADAFNRAAELDLPQLIGTDKQHDWALRVRHELLRDSYSALVEEGDLTDDEYDTQILMPARLIDKSRWWIDNREHAAADLPELLEAAPTDPAAATTENPY